MQNKEGKDSDPRIAFTQHLEKSSEIVKSWPAWKQSVLGGSVHNQSEPGPKFETQCGQKDHNQLS